MPRLEAAGVRRVFPPATPLGDIVAWVKANVAR
jgi:methylmalonyl-CoA mutase cobalamin-binding subunit